MSIYRGFRLTKILWNARSQRYEAAAEGADGARVETVAESLHAALVELRLRVDRVVSEHKTYEVSPPAENTLTQEEIEELLNGPRRQWPLSSHQPAEALKPDEIEEWLSGTEKGDDQ